MTLPPENESSAPPQPKQAKPSKSQPTVAPPPPPPADEVPAPPDPAAPRKRRSLWRYLLFALLGLLIFTATLAASTYAGLYYGERDRVERREQIKQDHYTAGVTALNEGRYERAAAEFQYVLQLDEDHTLAQQGLSEARTRLDVQPTPTSEAAQSLAEQLLEQAQADYEADEWAAAASTLTQLRALDATYEQEQVEKLLFTSLYSASMKLLEEDQLEAGIFYLDQAVALRPLDAEAVHQRNLAARYLEALGYWGVDWEQCITKFEALYSANPAYRDVYERLYRAYVAYADYWMEQGEMCPAERNYAHALRLYADPTVDQKRDQAAQGCLIATPTPISGAGVTTTTVGATPEPVKGFTMGRLAYPVYNAGTGVYDLYALYADGRILRVAANADQPWWERGTGRVAYRDRMSNGISMVLPEEGVPLQLLQASGQAWPTLSPDSQRIAYAAPNAEGVWTIYVASAHGGEEPRSIGQGWAPAWGPNGLLAYTGCDAEDKCGITLDNPDDDAPGTRLTGNQADSAVSWSPAGNLMAYMSNVAGNWDLFLLNPDGGVQQLTTDPSNEGMPAWSPDGGSLAFVSDRSGNWGIYVMQIDGQNVQRIVDLGPSLPGWDNQRLSWAP
ncbi:MAG: hypothetical protein ACLFTI_04220, partial [Anaerolineales bacterium]